MKPGAGQLGQAGPYGSAAREEMIAAQRARVEQLKVEIFESVGDSSDQLDDYQAEYHRQFEALVPAANGSGGAQPVAFSDLIDEIACADIVYFGDYHTLREAQKAPLRCLREVLARGRTALLATEVVHLIHQDILDDYLDGLVSDEGFLERIEYAHNWGFPWRNYALQFQFARENEIPMLGINSDPAVLHDNLHVRDAMAAMVIVEAMAREPDRLVAVTFGDLHICPTHLPAQVQRFVERRGLDRKKHVVVYQNNDAVYWELARRGLEQEAHTVRLADGSFCLMNSTPLVKFQSYVNWETNADELEESIGLEGPSISSNVMTDQVVQMVETVTSFLELPQEGLEDFTVHTSRDLNFLDDVARTGNYSADEIAEIRHQIARDDSYFLIREKMIYLGNLSIDHAAEEATHYVNTKLAGHVQQPPSRRFDFYYRAMKEAIGFVGSRIVHHKRDCFDRADFDQILAAFKGRRLTEPGQIFKREIARDVLQHLDYEERWVRGEVRGYPRFRALYERELQVHLGVTHSLGYMLGDRIHTALVAGRIHRKEVRELFFERFDSEPRPREVYFDWLDYLRP
ncbi:MAG: ChaN family lipoprotein [Planctomycetota bacterium]